MSSKPEDSPIMTFHHLFCFGYGYTAQFFASRLAAKGWRVSGTARSPEKAAAMERAGVAARLWGDDGFDPHWLDGAGALLITTPQ